MATVGSPKYKLNAEDLQKVGTGALIAVGGALLTYFAEIVTQIDFGAYTPVVVALSSVLVNTGRKFLKDL